MKILHSAACLGASLAALAGATAHAQEAPPAAPQASAAKGNDDLGYSEIIVTATRRSERLHDVPGAVSAVSGDFLDQIKAKSLVDFAAFTPGVSFQASSPNSNKIVIRGVTTGGNQLNSAIGLYLDDVPIGSSTPFGGGANATNVGLFDLQRIEVLSGPQGTLFGANALGGTLRYITEGPQLDALAVKIEGEGNYTAHGEAGGALRAFVNAPLGQQVAVRLTGTAQKDAGFIDDPDHDRSNLGDSRLLQGRGSILLEASPSLSIQLNGFAQRIKSNGYAVAMRDPVTHRSSAGDYEQSFDSGQESQTELYVGSGVINWKLGGVDLTSITAYQRIRNDGATDLGVAYSAILGGVLGPAGINPYVLLTESTSKRFTQEIRLASESGGAIEWVAGGFYSRERTFQRVIVYNNADPEGQLLGLPLGQFDLPSTAKDFALFANATLKISSTLDVTAGARQTWSDQVFASSGFGLVVNPSAPTTTITGFGKSKESVQTFLFNLRYRPNKATMLYARVASGYRPGGPNLQTGGAGTGNQSFDSDTLWNYEIGLKQNIGTRSFVNLSAYHIDWTNIQQVRNIGGVNQLVNAGNARINGAEASASLGIASGLTVLVTGAYTDAKLTTPAPLLDIAVKGARLPLSAKFSGAVSANYDFAVAEGAEGSFSLSLRHVGARNAGYAESSVAPLYRLASYQVVDANLSLRVDGGWEISPFIKNIFDVKGEISASMTTNQFVPAAPVPVTLTQPRTFGVVLNKGF